MTVAPRPGDPKITPALVAEHGLTDDEFQRIVKMLGREPTFTELGIVSALAARVLQGGSTMELEGRTITDRNLTEVGLEFPCAAQASDRGCGQPPGPLRAVGRLHHAARRCTYFCTYFTVTYFRTLKRPPQPFGPGNPPVT